MRVAEGVEQYTDQDIVNWFLIETDEGPVAVDAAFPTAWRQVEHRARELRAIVLTHAHIDHLGFAERARRTHGVPVYVPEGDAELARHTLKYAKSERNPLIYALRYGPTRKLYWRALKSGGVRGELLKDFRTYGDGDELPGGLKAIFTPGHTKGHMALHLPERDVVFAGDAVVTRDPYTDRTGPRLVARAATWNSEKAAESLDRIAATGARIVAVGHGDPFRGGAEAAAGAAREAGAA
jgi:glyoxylase-like metal-dependent hydrolase (beta-lactamase superfamily II)